MRIASVGHAIYAATLIALGILGLSNGDFAPVFLPVSKTAPGREVLIYLCAFVSISCGIGLFLRRSAPLAARVLFIYLFVWMLLFKGRFILMQPTVEASYQSCGETAVIVAAAWALYVWFAAAWDRRRLGLITGENGLRGARILYGLALIAFGLSHFVYVKQTVVLVPAWLGFPTAWAYFTGSTYLAAGVAIIANVYARLAALLSALQIGLFTLLVWIPIVATGHVSETHWIEFVVSWTITAGAWVMADSYRKAASNVP